MLLTEQEAKTKRCRAVPNDVTTVYHPMTHHDGYGHAQAVATQTVAMCLGSECMMWRERGTWEYSTDGDSNLVFRGWCGLAGRPEE